MMRSFTTPFTCSVCKTEFCNPISLVKHVELEHPTALKLSTINITRGEHRTYSGLLIESIIVSEFKNSNTLPIYPENHGAKISIDNGGIETSIEKNLGNKFNLSEKEVHKESLEIANIENCMEENLENKSRDYSTVLSEK